MNHILIKLLSEKSKPFYFQYSTDFLVDAIENNFKIYTNKQSLLFGC